MNHFRTFITLLAIVVASGCGSSSGKLTGKVSYKGKPVASGTVVVFGSDGLPYYGKIAVDGSYSVEGVPAGDAKVGVNSPNPVPDPDRVAAAKLRGSRGGKQQENAISATPSSDPKLWFELPAKYADPNTSEIRTTLKNGDNRFDIELQ